ncbi:MAG: hypothetical protein WC736_14725 [Gallionella sp.]|jgi:hypothetical protein
MYTEYHNPNKVIIPREEVAEFVDARPDCGLNRGRAYWFEFDQDGHEIDNDSPVQNAALDALSAYAWRWLQDNGPLLRDGVMREAVGHTPGPWAAADTLSRTGLINVYGPGRPLPIAIVTGDYKTEREANARLIAAAPELLEALQAMLEIYGPRNGAIERDGPCNYARAAIAKATGKKV